MLLNHAAALRRVPGAGGSAQHDRVAHFASVFCMKAAPAHTCKSQAFFERITYPWPQAFFPSFHEQVLGVGHRMVHGGTIGESVLVE